MSAELSAVTALVTRGHVRAEFLAADLSDEHAAENLADRTVAALGRIDVLVNHAGVFPFRPTEQTRWTCW